MKTTAAQYRLPRFTWADERLAYLKAWPLLQLYWLVQQNKLTIPTILFSLKPFDHYGRNIIPVMIDAAILEIASHRGRVVCVLYLFTPWSPKENSGCASSRWQGSCMQFPHLLQNGALLDHCLFNVQRIIQTWGCPCAVGLSGFPLFIHLFSKSKILPHSQILHMWFEFPGQECLRLRTAKRKPGQRHHSCSSDP